MRYKKDKSEVGLGLYCKGSGKFVKFKSGVNHILIALCSQRGAGTEVPDLLGSCFMSPNEL